MNTSEVAAIGEAKDTSVEFESDIDVDAVFALIGALQQFFGICKPEELAVEFEMHGQQAAVQIKKDIFALTLDGMNTAAL